MRTLGSLARLPRTLPPTPGRVRVGGAVPSASGGGAVASDDWAQYGETPIDPRPPDRCLLRLEGEYWTIVYAGTVVRMRDAVGLRHLAQLLWYPQREVHALDLMRALALAGGSQGGRRAGTAANGVDAPAATDYRRRIRDLEEELTGAELQDDLGRIDSIRRELDALVHELRDGARGRHLRVDAERARVAVTKAIKATLARLRPAHPALGAHLDAAVKRGYVCVYRPDPRCPIQWGW